MPALARRAQQQPVAELGHLQIFRHGVGKRQPGACARGGGFEARAGRVAEQRLGGARAENARAVAGQRRRAGNLVFGQRRGQHRQRRKGALHLGAALGLHGHPVAEEGLALRLRRQQPVQQHGVAGQAEEREIAVGALRLVNGHALRRRHQADAALPARQQLAQPGQAAVEQALGVAEHRRPRQRNGRDALRQRRHHRGQTALNAQQQAKRAARHLGQRHHAQRRAGRRAIHHHQVVAAPRKALNGQQRRQFLGPRQQRKLFGHHLFNALVAQQMHQIRPHRAPVPLALGAGVHLHRIQARRHRARLRPEAALQHISQAVRRIRRCQQRPRPALRSQRRRRRRAGGLAHPALSRVEDQTHLATLSPSPGPGNKRSEPS